MSHSRLLQGGAPRETLNSKQTDFFAQDSSYCAGVVIIIIRAGIHAEVSSCANRSCEGERTKGHEHSSCHAQAADPWQWRAVISVCPLSSQMCLSVISLLEICLSPREFAVINAPPPAVTSPEPKLQSEFLKFWILKQRHVRVKRKWTYEEEVFFG